MGFGEQMLHRRFSELIYSIPRNRPYRLVINTNGSLFTPLNLDALNRFDLVRFSIDSTTSESFEHPLYNEWDGLLRRQHLDLKAA